MTFEENNVIYDRDVDFRENTADYFIIKTVHQGAKVLELGCSTGYMTKYLNEKMKCENSAIEIDENALKQVSSILKYSINEDLNIIEKWIDKLPEKYFDYIICQDVLEHLLDPFKVLRYLKSKLVYKGKFLVSIPNVSHNTVLMQLLRDNFEYKDIGILDKTHIRFYTKDTFAYEAKNSRLKCINHFITYLVPEGTGWGTNYKDYSLQERDVLLKNGSGHVFQNLFILGKEEDFEEIKDSELFQLSLKDFDELRVYENNKGNLYYYKNGEDLKYIIKSNNISYLEIEPTIRPIEYSIEVSINGEKYSICSFMCNDSNININSGNFVNLNNQKIQIKHDFVKGDIVRIKIENKSNAIENLISGELGMMNELNKLKKKVKENDIISFDIFDTLVLRNVLFPKDIFRILNIYVKENYGIENFYRIRVESEQETRNLIDREDITFDEIYETIEKKLNISCKIIKEKELELEEEFIVVNPFMKQIFHYAKNLNKKIYIISDMYLSKSFISKVIKKIGYDGYDELFVSSELKKTKATGSIYKHIIEKHDNINTEKWLHIGDNYQSDIKNAEKLKINTFYYRTVRERAKVSEEDIDIKLSVMQAIQYNRIYNGLEIPYWEKFGIEYIAPIYYGFTDWIARLNEKSDNIVFLSRDGYIPKIVFDKMKKKRNLNNIDSIYLYTSRKAYQLPSLAYMDKGEMVECLTQSSKAFGHNLTINEMFKNAGLDPNDYMDIIRSFGFKSKEDIIDGEERHMAKKVVQSIYEDIVKVLKKKCDLVQEYLEQENMFKYERLNIVDIGWRGSIQHSMQKLFNNYYEMKGINKKANIYGYYLGTNEFVYSDIVDNTFGYYFDYSIPWYNSSFCIENLMMYEFIFTCPQPQLIGFEKKDNKIIPIFRDFIENKDYTSSLQGAAMNIIDEFIEFDDYIKGISIKDCTDPYRKFIEKRNYNDMKEFRKISNFISYDTEEKPYVTSYSKSEIINNQEEVYKETKMNLWPYAFIVDEIDDEKEYKEFIKKNHIEMMYSHDKEMNRRFICKENIKKGIKHPLRGIKAILKKIIIKIMA